MTEKAAKGFSVLGRLTHVQPDTDSRDLDPAEFWKIVARR